MFKNHEFLYCFLYWMFKNIFRMVFCIGCSKKFFFICLCISDAQNIIMLNLNTTNFLMLKFNIRDFSYVSTATATATATAKAATAATAARAGIIATASATAADFFKGPVFSRIS